MIELLERVIADIQYLEGWTFSAAGGGRDAPRVMLHIETQDADNGDPMVAQFVAEFRPLPLGAEWTEHTVALAIWRLVMRAHRHEAGEFLLWRGQRVADPHRSAVSDDRRAYDARLALVD